MLLSDGYIANGAEPWKLPDVADLPDISIEFATEPNHTDADGDPEFWPYLRDPDTLARPWALPGTPGLMHRIGGIEKEDGIGQHQLRPRQPRADGPAPGRPRSPASPPTSRPSRSPATSTTPSCSCSGGAPPGAPSTAPWAGCATGAARSPTPTSPTSTRSRPTSATVLARYPKVVVPEMNLGQLVEAGPGRVPRRRPLDHQGAGHALHRRRARTIAPRPASEACRRDRRRRPTAHDHPQGLVARTRRSGGARAAATTRSSPPCSS